MKLTKVYLAIKELDAQLQINCYRRDWGWVSSPGFALDTLLWCARVFARQKDAPDTEFVRWLKEYEKRNGDRGETLSI